MSNLSHNKIADFVKNLSYTFSANILSLLISVAVVLIIPKVLGTDQYGYYQLYTFYCGYVGISYFGWCEGIYLRNGGKYYDKLNKETYHTQLCVMAAYEVTVFTAIFGIASIVCKDTDKKYVIGYTCIVAIAVCMRFLITSVLQSTSRIKEYATVTISEKIFFIILVSICVLNGFRNYHSIIISNVFAVYFSLFLGMLFCKDIVFSKIKNIKNSVHEIKENIIAGIKLQMSTICSMLILGVVRFGIERRWDISTFGKVSLTLSISNMAVTAINAIGVVIYPILRRTNQEKLPEIYKIMRIMLMGLVFGALVFYYPAQKILTLWLPQYAESLRYAAILLPVCVYESKVSILVNTYFNTLRLESLQMKCNLTALALSVILTGVSIYVFDSVTVAILSILIVLMFRCILCEIVLSTKIPIKVVKDIIIELVMTLAFIICNWYFGFIGMLMYAVCYVIYLIIKRKDILESLNFIKSMR